jgi:hypothetical protein
MHGLTTVVSVPGASQFQFHHATEQQPAPSTSAGEAGTANSDDKKKQTYYFEFAKRKWESEDTFRLPDGSYWPEVTANASLEAPSSTQHLQRLRCSKDPCARLSCACIWHWLLGHGHCNAGGRGCAEPGSRRSPLPALQTPQQDKYLCCRRLQVRTIKETHGLVYFLHLTNCVL